MKENVEKKMIMYQNQTENSHMSIMK